MPSMWHHSVMAALTGDIYNMLQTRSNNRSAASSLGKVQLSSEETKKQNPEIIKPSEIRSQQDGSNDNMVSREVTDTGTGGRRNESASAIETALNSVRVWLGDDYQFTKREADALHALVINSEDPVDAVSRFVSAKGINALTGMDIQTAYANLDQISEYWNGSKFEAKDISFAQKIHNGFARLDIMKLKDQWRTLDFEGKTDEAAALEAEILKMEQELGDVSSALPKNTLDKFSTWALENLGYTFVPAVKGGLASVSTTALGSALVGAMALNPIAAASAMGIVTATSVMAGTVVSMDEMTRYERGEMYWDYMHNYDKKDKPLAYVMSEFGGRLVGIIETLLDGVSSRALGLATGGLTSSVGLNAIARINNKGALNNIAAATIDWVTGGLDEAFLNELPEYFLAEAMDALYMNANDIEDTKTFKERLAEAKEQVWSGFVVGMIYGTFNVPMTMIQNKTLSLELRRTANTSQSFSEFIQKTNSMEKPEGISQADWDDARRKVYETSVQQRNELVKGTVVESESIAAEELFSTFNPETGEDNAPQPNGKIYRSEEGKLYSEVRSEAGSDVVYFGDKDTGAIYGAVEIVSDGNTQTVQQVRVRPGYEGIRSEMVLDAIDSTQTSETEIVWNPKTEGLTKVRDSLIENNPAGKEAGLRYEFRSKASDAYLSSTKDMIKSAVPGISDSEAMLAAKITSIADRGTGTISYGNTADMSEAQLQGRTLEEIRGATDKARSLIYVGQNSDFSTFIHELFHATTSQRLQESKELSTKINEAFGNEVSKNQLRQFIADRIQIWGKDANVDSIMQNLSTIESGKPTWTISQEENLARLYEAYRSSYASSSQNLSSGIRAVLRKIAQYMNSIYQTLRQSSSLNKDIADAYDKLMGFNNTDFSDVSKSEYSNSEVKTDKKLMYQESQDSRYLAAVERGDMETAQRMVDAKAAQKGYVTREDYRDTHVAPGANIGRKDFTNLDKLRELRDDSFDLNLYAIANGITNQPEDYFTPIGLRYYGTNDPMADRQSFYAIMDAIRKVKDMKDGDPIPEITVYRAVPRDIKGKQLESDGQWVTPSRYYAKLHGEGRFEGKYRIIEQSVPVTELWWDGNDANEWGFDDGSPSVYKNIPNNRKLTDAVTYDDDGNVIPLSKRFTQNNPDIRYQDNDPETSAFKNWFGDWENDSRNASKMVDKNGRPLVCFHGSYANFDTFEMKYHLNDDGYFGKGYYFTFSEDPSISKAEAKFYGPVMYSCYLNIRNPFDFSQLYIMEGKGRDVDVALYNLYRMFPEMSTKVKILCNGKEIGLKEYASLYENTASRMYLDQMSDGEYVWRLKLDHEPKNEFEEDYYSWLRYTTKEDAENGRIDNLKLFLKDKMNINFHQFSYYITQDSALFSSLIKDKGYDGILQSKNGDEAVVFEPNQIKSATNNNGEFSASSNNIYFQTSSNNGLITEKNGTLVLTHELSQSKLKEVDALGGMPMPSLAISKPELDSGFGDVILLGNNAMANMVIDGGYVWNRDIWSPTVPKPEYSLTDKNKRSINTWLRSIGSYISLDNYYKHQYLDPGNISSLLSHQEDIKKAYLSQKGIEIETPYRNNAEQFPETIRNKALEYVKDNPVDYDNYDEYMNAVSEYIRPEVEKLIDAQERAFRKRMLREAYIDEKSKISSLIAYAENPEEKVVDSLALSRLIDEKAPEKDVEEWIYENINRYYSAPYITIDNRKYEYNLMNIFKSMMSQGNVGAAENTALTFSQGLTNSYAARRLSTRAQMATEERLLSAEKESGEKVNSLYDKYHELATKNYKWSDTWEALNDSGRALAEYLKSDDRSYKLMEKALKKRDFTPVDTLVNTAMELADAIDSMSREYFEAKPSHIMKLSDFSVALIPDNATEETVSILNKAGLQTSVYDRSKRSTAIQDYLDSDEYMKSQILFQDQDELTDFFDGISDIDDAIDLTESIGGPDYELSADDMGGNWDWEIPQDWNAIYDMDAVDEEEYIQEQAPTVEAGDKTILAPVLNSDGVLYIEGTQDLERDWKSFVELNKPEIEYTGTEEQKDAIFRKAIEDEVVLRRYLAIMGEALLHGTYSTNATTEETYNSAYDRYETVKRIVPFVDEAYRTSLMQRLMKQVVDGDVRKAVAYALDSKEWPKTTNLKKKVIKEMGSNARFYRNIIAPLISDKSMLPEVLIDNGGLQLPSRQELDLLDTRALADLASKARNEEARRRILSGDLRFGSDVDENQLKMVADTIKDQAQRIKDAEAKIKELEKQETVLDEGINSLSEAIKERDGAIADAEKILSDLSAVLSGTNPSSTRKELNDRYAKAMAKLNDLNSEEEWQKRSTAKGSRDKGKRMGARLGTQEYMSELRGMYPELFTTLDKDGNKTYLSWTGKRTSDDKQIRLNIEAERVRLQEELKEIRLGLLRSATRIIGANSSKMTTALKDIRNISSGDSTVIPTSDYEKLYEGEKSLQRQISRSYRMIENRNSKISDLNKEITELRRSLRSATAAASRADSRTEYVKTKSKENLQRQKQALLEASSEEKKQMKENLAKRKALQQLRKEKAKIAAAIMAPVNLATTDYDTAAGPVAAIQALIDPQFRRDWVYDISENPMQATGFKTMSIEEAKEYLSTLDDAQKTDLFSYMPQDLVERLTEQKKPLNDWTLEELKEMALAVEALKKRGREVLAAKKDARKAQAVAIQRAILKAVGQDSDESLPGSIERMSEGRSISRRFHSATYATRRMQELSQLLDGGYGNKGAAYRLLVTEKRLHQDNEARAIEKRQMKINPLLTEEVINQLSDTVEVDFGSFKRKFTVDQLGYIMLSQGDEQNKNAVAYGALLSESEKGTVINHKEMMDVLTGEVKDVSEFLSRSKDLIADDNELKRVGLERYDIVLRVAKEEIQKRGLTDLVEAIGDDFSSKENSDRLDRASIEWFNTPLDKRDVYLPIHRTDSQGVDFENAMADSLFNLNANKMIRNPEKGFTISRIEISPRHQKNIDMSLVGVWQTAVREQEHLIEFAGYIKKLRQVFQGNGSSELRRAVDMRYTSALMPQIDSYIDLVANPETRPRRNSSDEIFKNLRGQTGAAYLGWKLSGLVLQAITSPAPGFSELKPWEVFSAYASIGMHPLESIEFINSRSIMMKNRTMNPIIDEVVRRKNQWGQTKGQRIYSKFMDVGQMGLTMVDRYAVAGSWMAMYQRTLKEQLQAGSDSVYAETAAIQKADEFILRTQPTGDVTELASLFRNQNEAAKTILQFQTSLNVIWNNLTANVVGMARQKKFSQIIGTFVGYAVAGLVLGMVQDGYDDDDETKAKVLKSLYWSLTQGLDSVPIVGSVVDGVVQKMVTGESSWATSRGVSVSPALDKVVQGLNAVMKKDWQTAISKTAEGAGIVAGMPVSGIKQAIEAAQQKSLWPLLGRN